MISRFDPPPFVAPPGLKGVKVANTTIGAGCQSGVWVSPTPCGAPPMASRRRTSRSDDGAAKARSGPLGTNVG